ncbi:hypothetical protein [Roseomonas xinghualingensis]|uniref:hypothetical protein n=1 Tax=Roseomonas xinghualingensis TaxID=2986475 RepID=UPI0021F0CD5E|nr:hypothetical protein [Roseomonas sp. SXEYE001]MCV4209489.1 hypothetical protein [Roseomonas sp. SXEYE001]
MAASSAAIPPSAGPPRNEVQGASLLQVLLGQPPAPPLPATSSAGAALSASPSLTPAAPQSGGMPFAPSLLGTASVWSLAREGEGTGSTLLDTLIRSSAPSLGHYPLLDALGEAMRGSPMEPSPSHWPAARVDIALPELLRRVAAGVRSAQTAA